MSVPRRRRRGLPVMVIAAIALVALAVAAAAVSDCIVHGCDEGGPRLSKAETARLPVKLSLANLCPFASSPPRLRRRLRSQGEALIRALREQPDATLRYTFYYDAEPAEETETITVRELADISLHEMDISGPHCAPRLAKRIKAAL